MHRIKINGEEFLPGKEITIGRTGNIVIGTDDKNMHRKALKIYHTDVRWVLENLSGYYHAKISAELTKWNPTEVPPKKSATLQHLTNKVQFGPKQGNYTVTIICPPPPILGKRQTEDIDGDPTIMPPSSNYDEERKQLLRVLAKHLAESQEAGHKDLPSDKELAAELGWTEKKTQQKISRFIETLKSRGVPTYRTNKLCLAEYALNNPHEFE